MQAYSLHPADVWLFHDQGSIRGCVIKVLCLVICPQPVFLSNCWSSGDLHQKEQFGQNRSEHNSPAVAWLMRVACFEDCCYKPDKKLLKEDVQSACDCTHLTSN